MIQKSKRNKIFIFFSIIFLILFFILNKKNIFVFFDNIQTIKNMSLLLANNKNKKKELLEKIDDFENKKEFRELIIKEKLFFKHKSEKVIFYNLDD
ncbi:MAG: hypothetical protein CMM92_00530 [Rickettsiales bacterium]|nr:hypothetical protein [Rickettsiales bacterium]RPG16210.1 MAG: hypothetical protein CBD55_000530 [Pelagibacteraceae bacterium TMED195]|tara:strand:+ start:286 stop:573 length:288 start_codon:yes stop_codon:yes gene_type:complete